MERARRLQAISAVVSAAGSLDELMDGLLAAVQAALEVDTVAVLLVDSDTRELVPLAVRGFENGYDADLRIQLGAGFAGRVATAGLGDPAR